MNEFARLNQENAELKNKLRAAEAQIGFVRKILDAEFRAKALVTILVEDARAACAQGDTADKMLGRLNEIYRYLEG